MLKLLKYISFGALAIVMLLLVVATIAAAVVPLRVTDICSSPVFVALWVVLALSAVAYIFSTPLRRSVAALLLHVALLVVLAGAFVTYLTGERGVLSLCHDAPPSSMFVSSEGGAVAFPFRLVLQRAWVERDDDNSSPRDYVAELVVHAGDGVVEEATLSLNNIYEREGYRFCLSSVGDDCVTLLVSHDPWGVAVTYVGYLFTILSFLALFVSRGTMRAALVRQMCRRGVGSFFNNPRYKLPLPVGVVVAALFFWGYITFEGVCRWVETGLFPVSTGAEALMFIAWCAFFAVVLFRKSRAIAFGAFFFAVLCAAVSFSSGAGASSAIHPVLRSPLLPLHVITIVGSYFFIGLLAVNALVALCAYWARGDEERLASMAVYGRIMLYYAVLLLVAGIFLGAAWANISWGRYWGWDPKEVWALITLILCSFGFHTRSWSFMARPLVFHAFCLVTFCAMLFTFFGVNYLLGGLHSYA